MMRKDGRDDRTWQKNTGIDNISEQSPENQAKWRVASFLHAETNPDPCLNIEQCCQ